ncbi:MAG: hypothetical protein H3C47_13075 [Candidatus Cloacimonetes bacterium]|nr:hypothetical protein [Candidatus Cloacimonadota bacterium]
MKHFFLFLGILSLPFGSDLSGTWQGWVKFECKVNASVTLEKTQAGYLGKYRLTPVTGCFIPTQLVAEIGLFSLSPKDGSRVNGYTKSGIFLDALQVGNVLSGTWSNLVGGPFELRRVSSEIIPLNTNRKGAASTDNTLIFDKLTKPFKH